MFSTIKFAFYALIRNIIAGSSLTFFRSSAFEKFNVSFDNAISIIFFNFLLSLGIFYLQSLPNPEFNSFAIAGYSLQIVGLLVTAIIMGKLKSDDSIILPVIIQISSTAPIITIVWAVVILIPFLSSFLFAYYLFILWAFVILAYITLHHFDRKFKKILIPMVCYVLLSTLPTMLIPTGDFWYAKVVADNDTLKYMSINQEELFYKQFDHLNTIKAELSPNRPNIQDLYFLGFGSYASEDVFMKEITYIQQLMDNKFNTKGRSVSLINNLITMNEKPIASKSNLERVLKIIGQTMDNNEDILFLYLTSHGSKKSDLSVSFRPLRLNSISPDDLKLALDNAEIKWRIILISACYSGGFIETLKDRNTLIMTAAAHDKTSFGCGSKSDFTYFGQAVFKEQLSENHSFIPAFEAAIKSIDQREKKDNLTPSLPQLSIGTDIKTKISSLERDQDIFYHR